MSDTTETDTAATDPVITDPADSAPVDPGADPQAEPDAEPDNNNEAAKYRRRLRDTEKQRDALAERVTAYQRTDIERQAAQHLADGADIWRDGAQLADLLTETGELDNDKITELCTTLADSHPHWRKRVPASPPASTVTANGKITDGAPPPRTWTDLLQTPTTQ